MTRAELMAGLLQCTDKHHEIFKLMYSPKNTKLSISEVVEKIPVEQLDWALSQVEKTIAGIREQTLKEEA